MGKVTAVPTSVKCSGRYPAEPLGAGPSACLSATEPPVEQLGGALGSVALGAASASNHIVVLKGSVFAWI